MATLEEIQQPIADKVRRYETFITEILHSDSGYVSSICNYILANRGKQMKSARAATWAPRSSKCCIPHR